jgi:hypothetical protein
VGGLHGAPTRSSPVTRSRAVRVEGINPATLRRLPSKSRVYTDEVRGMRFGTQKQLESALGGEGGTDLGRSSREGPSALSSGRIRTGA